MSVPGLRLVEFSHTGLYHQNVRPSLLRSSFGSLLSCLVLKNEAITNDLERDQLLVGPRDFEMVDVGKSKGGRVAY